MPFLSFFSLPLRILTLGVLFFMLCRGLFLVQYWDYFSELSVGAIVSAFLIGAQFDVALVVLSLIPVFLILTLPFSWIQHRYTLNTLAIVSSLVLIVLIGVYIGDITYFDEVKRHMGEELIRLKADAAFLIEMGLSSRLGTSLTILLFIIVYAVCAYLFLIKYRKPVTLPSRWWQKTLLCLFTLITITWMGRGMQIGAKPINSIDAFATGNQKTGNLALNGAYVAAMALLKDPSSTHRFLDDTTYQTLKIHAGQAPLFKNAPIQNHPLKGKNVMIVLLESWSYKYIDGLANGGYGATPYMDSLIKQSYVWDNFYAAGQRSILGIQAVLSSVPILPKQDPLGYGLELNNLSRMAENAKQQDYATLMIQSSERRSFYMENIARNMGFEHYYGKEDVPPIKNYPSDTPTFGWDHDTLQFALNTLSGKPFQDQPFLSFIFTGTTHEPYANPGNAFLIRPHEPSSLNGYLNTLRYSDWSVEQFMKRASKQDWYNNTVFFFLADHVLRAGSTTPLEKFHIPLIMFTPDGSLPRKHTHTVASQYDILPTVNDITGSRNSVYSFGQSLLLPKAKRRPYIGATAGDMMHYISESEWATFVQQQTLEQSNTPLPEKEKNQLNQLKFRYQVAQDKLKRNQWAPQ